MHRTAIALTLVALSCACTRPAPQADASDPHAAQAQAQAQQSAEPKGKTIELPPPGAPKAKPPIIRKDLVAEDLPPVPTLESIELTSEASGQFEWPEGSDEIAPRAAVALTDGLLLAGQVYFDRQYGRPSASWAWLGVAPSSGTPSSTKFGEGAVRAAISDGHGGALLAGITGAIRDPRGWFGVVDAHGQLGLQVTLDSPAATELFDLIPGRSEGELAVVAGYVDAQGWLVSLDGGGAERWQKFIGSYGYTQPRVLARLERELLVIGTRSQKFGESWWGRAPADGGADASGADVTQDKLEIAGADQHQMLRAVVELGDAGVIAIGTGKRNYIQDHDQLLAVGFDPSGAVTWSKLIPELRVTEIFGGGAVAGAASFVVSVPGSSADAATALALVEIAADGSASVKQIADSQAWLSAGMIEGASSPSLLGYAATGVGVQWRRWSL